MKISVYTDKRRKTAKGAMPVRLRFQPHRGSAFLISTGLECFNEPANCTFSPAEPNAKTKSFRLMKLFTACQDHIYQHPDLTKERMKEELAAIITGRPARRDTISDMFEKYTSGKRESYRKMYERTAGKIAGFDDKATFETIDRKWLERFASWLEKEGANTNGIAHHMRNLRAVFNFAIEEEVTNNYPFRKYRIKSEQTRKRDLTVEQLRQLRDHPCEPFQQKYVDLFFLMFYLCGINAGDLFTLKESNINNGRIEYYRQKTKKYYSIKIEPEAAHIINKYRGKDWLLDVMDTNVSYSQPLKRMNQQLKKVGMSYQDGMGWTGEALQPELSSYYARHTWASIAAEVDVPMDVIAQALGHSTPYMTTDIYVNRRLRKIDEANRRVIDYFKSGE